LNAQAEKDLAERKALAVELQKQVDALKVSLQSCQSDASAAVKQCATKTQSLSEELKTLNVRYEKSVGDLADAKAQLKIADADHVSCASEVKIHKSSIASLESKLVQCETDKKSCNEARDAAVKRVQALDKESAEFRHMIKDLSRNHDAKVGDLLKQLASAQSSVDELTVRASDCDKKVQSSVDQLTVRASDCDKKVQLASSDAQKLHSQIAAQEAVIKAKDAVIKTDEQKIQALTQQKKELEADMTAHRAATESKAALKPSM